MSQISIQSNAIANVMVSQIISEFQRQILTKEVVKKLPEKLQQNLRQLTSEIVYTKNIPRPYLKRQPPIIEDIMPAYQSKQPNLVTKVPVLTKENISRLQMESALKSNRTSKTTRHLSSQQLRGVRNFFKINLENLNANKVIQLRNQQQTAKSFRPAIQIQSHITEIRKNFLRQIIEKKQKLNQTSKQSFATKKKRIPKEFTYSYDFSLLQNSLQMKNGTLRSPLKTKSISIGKIVKKVKNPEIPADLDSNLQEQLARMSTALPQKEKRAYRNSSQRQVSHFPYISLGEKSVLYQNDNVLRGPGSVSLAQTSQSWKMKSSFKPFFDRAADHLSIDLITQNEDVVFPSTIKKQLLHQNNDNGLIVKNSRQFKKSFKNEEKQSRQFSLLNVTRNLAIGQHHRFKAIDK